MGTCHIIIAILVGLFEDNWLQHPAAGWVSIVFVWLFAINFGWSWGPSSWVLVSEVFPLSVRAKGMSIGTSSNWMNNFIVGQVSWGARVSKPWCVAAIDVKPMQCLDWCAGHAFDDRPPSIRHLHLFRCIHAHRSSIHLPSRARDGRSIARELLHASLRAARRLILTEQRCG